MSEEHRHDHSHEHGHHHGHVHSAAEKKAVINRISRAIGHLESIKRMIERDEDCSQVLIQLAAVKSAINNTGKVVLKNHISECIVEAVEHINKHSTKHSETIITNDDAAAEYFLKNIDSACVYHNPSTRFSDGFLFGLGAEIGISTQKLHARGPMGLEALVTTKYNIKGDGAVRK